MYESHNDSELLNLYILKKLNHVFKIRQIRENDIQEIENFIEEEMFRLRLHRYLNYHYIVSNIKHNKMELTFKIFSDEGRKHILCTLQTLE